MDIRFWKTSSSRWKWRYVSNVETAAVPQVGADPAGGRRGPNSNNRERLALCGSLFSSPASATYPWLWWFPFGWFIFIPVFFLIFFAVRWYFWGGWWWGRGWYYGYDPALDTLRQRFAKGEITKEQYDQMRRDLERPEQSPAR